MPADSRIWIGGYEFDLADIASPHTVEPIAIGPTGPIDLTMATWVNGMQNIEQGIEYRKGLNTYITSKGVDAAFPGQVICQPVATTIAVGSGPALGAVLKQIDFTPSGGTLNSFLVENQRYAHKFLSGVLTQAVDLGSGQLGKDGIAHGGYIAIGYGSGGQVYSSDGVTFTTATANKADAYAALGSNLYRAVRPNTVFAASAVNGAWDSGTSVGDAGYNINSMGGVEQILMVGKENGMYSYDNDGTVTEFTPELHPQANANFASLRASDSFNSDYYFRTLNGAIEISGADGTKSRVGLDQLATPDLPAVPIKAFCHDDRYLYALVENADANLTILRRTVSGKWHVYYTEAPASNHQGMHIAVSSVLGYPALFFSYFDLSSTYTLKFIRLSTFPNPLQDTNYRYDTATTGRLRIGRFGSPEAQMVIDQIIIQSRNLAAGITITPYIAADGGAITQFGSAGASSSPSTPIYPTTPVTANFIDLYLDLATNSATVTPVLVGFSLKGTYRPNYRRIHTYTLDTQRAHKSIRSGRRKEAPTEAAADLTTLLGTNTYQVLKDERGNSGVSVLMMAMNRKVMRTDAGEEAKEVIQVVLQEKTAP